MAKELDRPNISPIGHSPVLLLIHILAAFLLHWLFPLPFAFPDILARIGYLLVLFGLGLPFRAVGRLLNASMTFDPHGSATANVTSGPYRISRNPIYLGFVCLLIGFLFMFRTYWGLILSPILMVLLYQLVIKHEEAYLEKSLGKHIATTGQLIFFKGVCGRLSKEGFAVLALDMYHGHVATTIEDAKRLRQPMDPQEPNQEIKSAVTFLGENSEDKLAR